MSIFKCARGKREEERVTNTILKRKERKRELCCQIAMWRKEGTKAEGNGETMGLFTFHQVTILWKSQCRELYCFEQTPRVELWLIGEGQKLLYLAQVVCIIYLGWDARACAHTHAHAHTHTEEGTAGLSDFNFMIFFFFLQCYFDNCTNFNRTT